MRELPAGQARNLTSAAGIENSWDAGVDSRSRLKSQAFLRLRRQRQVEQIHRLGPRVVFEFIDQLDRDRDLGADLDRQLERFAGLDPALVRWAGADRFPPVPIHALRGDR